ncbi:MAG: hypothetical protein AB7O80_12230 [Acetobacteraceae bacterium]
MLQTPEGQGICWPIIMQTAAEPLAWAKPLTLWGYRRVGTLEISPMRVNIRVTVDVAAIIYAIAAVVAAAHM